MRNQNGIIRWFRIHSGWKTFFYFFNTVIAVILVFIGIANFINTGTQDYVQTIPIPNMPEKYAVVNGFSGTDKPVFSARTYDDFQKLTTTEDPILINILWTGGGTFHPYSIVTAYSDNAASLVSYQLLNIPDPYYTVMGLNVGMYSPKDNSELSLVDGNLVIQRHPMPSDVGFVILFLSVILTAFIIAMIFYSIDKKFFRERD